MEEKALALPESSPETEIRQHEGIDWVFYNGEPFVELGKKKALPDFWCHTEDGYEVGRCKMIKRDGQRCHNACRRGWTVCHYHGAGRPSNPGGLSNKSAMSLITTGRHSKHLPHRLVEQYEAYLTDPDALSMAAELSLLDTRIAEILDRLDSSDTDAAWGMVKRASGMLGSDKLRNIEEIKDLLVEALQMKANDSAVWSEVCGLIDQRRKVAEAERKRIIDAQQMMTYQEANTLVAYLMNSVMEHVTDPRIRRAISDDLKRVTM